MTRLDELLYEMTRYDDKDVKRIQHFLKVHEFPSPAKFANKSP